MQTDQEYQNPEIGTDNEPQVEDDFFALKGQKKDSTVSLSENDANSPRMPATLQPKEKQISADPSTLTSPAGLDFDPNEQQEDNDEDFFDPLEYPVKKRSLSNGDSFFPQQHDTVLDQEIGQATEKLAVTVSDPNSSEMQSSLSQEGANTFAIRQTDATNRPSDETKSNTDESKSQENVAKKYSDSSS